MGWGLGDNPWGSSSYLPPAELLNLISKLFLPTRIAELGNGWNSSSFPARGFSTGQRGDFWGMFTPKHSSALEHLIHGCLESQLQAGITRTAGKGRKNHKKMINAASPTCASLLPLQLLMLPPHRFVPKPLKVLHKSRHLCEVRSPVLGWRNLG